MQDCCENGGLAYAYGLPWRNKGLLRRKEESMKILIKNGRVLDPSCNLDQKLDIWIVDGYVEKVGAHLEVEADKILQAEGCYVMPGFIDLHVHLRDPGLTHKETLETGSRAAARGGYTTICAMPNTKPVIDSPERVAEIHNRAKTEALVHVLQIGAITKGQEGKELADLEGMARAGAPAFSEDGKSVMDVRLYQKAMEEAARLGVPVFAHCEEKELVGKGVLQKGPKVEELGVEGISNAVEDIITARDIILAKETNVRLHLCHCSTAGSVTMIREGKAAGVKLTAEVCPHHFTLTVDDIPGGDTNYKMNPPLRNREDVEALKDGLKKGIIEVISTDHAPHHAEEKAKGMAEAPFGIVGLETAAALTYTELVETGILSPLQMAACMSYNPARTLGSERGTLKEGRPADVVIFDPNAEYEIDKEQFASKGKNTPFHGRKVKGRVLVTLVDGKVVWQLPNR